MLPAVDADGEGQWPELFSTFPSMPCGNLPAADERGNRSDWARRKWKSAAAPMPPPPLLPFLAVAESMAVGIFSVSVCVFLRLAQTAGNGGWPFKIVMNDVPKTGEGATRTGIGPRMGPFGAL